jgi:hypothetical protein
MQVVLRGDGDGFVTQVSETVDISPGTADSSGFFSRDLPPGAVLESVQTMYGQDLPYTLDGRDGLGVTLSDDTTGFDPFVIVYSLGADLSTLDGDEVWSLPISGASWQSSAPDIHAVFYLPDEYLLAGPLGCASMTAPCSVTSASPNSVVVSIDDIARGVESRVSIWLVDSGLPRSSAVDEPAPTADLQRRDGADCPAMTPASFTDGFATTVADHCEAVKEQHRWPAKPGLAIVILSALIIAVTLIGRRRTQRGPRPNDIIIAQYAPPKGLNIMVAAHLLGRSRTAVPAQLLALALSKNLRILERSMRRGRIRYAVQFITFDGADAHGAAMLRALFSDDPQPAAICELQAHNQGLARRVARVSTAALREVRHRAWRRSGGALQWMLLVLALVLTLITGSMFVVALLSQSFSPWFFIAFFAAPVALAVSFFSIRLVGAVTPSGAVIRDHLLGIRDYLRLAEADRLRMLQGADTAEKVDRAGATRMVHLYETLLPYAVVWSIDESWIAQLVGNSIDLDAAPEWLSNPNLLTVAGAAYEFSTAFSSLKPGRDNGSFPY